MTETTGPLSRTTGRPFWRAFLMPALVIGAIAFSIWWLEYRPSDEAASPLTGEEYGVKTLPVSLAPSGSEVGPSVGRLAPDFLLPGLDGADIRLRDMRGRPVVLNFWASWCAPCRQEIPQLVAAFDRFRPDGLVVLAVNVQEDRETIARYAREFGMSFPVPIDRSGEVVDQYRLLGLPTTYFIDPEGVIKSIFRGPFLEKTRGTRVSDAIGESVLTARIREILD